MMDEKEKHQDEIIKFTGHIEPDKTKDLGHGVVEVIISTPNIDYYGESISLDGINLKEYHGTVLYGHDYEGLPIGKALKVWKDKAVNALKGKVQFAVEEYPFAKTVYDLIKGGYLTDISIGGLVNKWNDDWTVIEEMTMKEFSVVPIGANKDAQIVALSLGKSLDEIKSEFNDAVRKHFVDNVKGMPNDQVKNAIESIKLLLTALEGEVDNSSVENVANMSRTKLVTLKAKAKEADKGVESIIKTIKVELKRKES